MQLLQHLLHLADDPASELDVLITLTARLGVSVDDDPLEGHSTKLRIPSSSSTMQIPLALRLLDEIMRIPTLPSSGNSNRVSDANGGS